MLPIFYLKSCNLSSGPQTLALGVMRLCKEKIHLHLPIESKFLDLEILKKSRTYKPKTFLYEFKLKGHAFFLKMSLLLSQVHDF